MVLALGHTKVPVVEDPHMELAQEHTKVQD